jgi:hypothetical protein
LLTKEAFAVYWRHLKPGGVLAAHITNRYADLAPVVTLAGAASGKAVRYVWTADDDATKTDSASWMLLTSRPGLFARPAFRNAYEIAVPKDFRGWTDDYSSLLETLN